jgi:predicted GH43/DUF377 family glycosyl hydrolase
MGQVHYSSFGLAILSDPFTIEKQFELPVFERDEDSKFEQFGVEDARITSIDGTLYIVYNSPSIYPAHEKKVNAWDHMTIPWRIRCSLAQTTDFITYRRHGVILPDVDSKDGVLFPEKVGGKYVLLHRVFPDIYISFSETIDTFDKGEILCKIREGEWDSERIGAGAVPIETELGWLEFYHGVRKNTDGSFKYMLGILLLDLTDPRKILYRSSEPIFEPETKYEKDGYVNNVVFTCGAIEWEGKYYVYYGAADTCVAVAFIGREELLGYLREQLEK